jgi:hypothetical protein
MTVLTTTGLQQTQTDPRIGVDESSAAERQPVGPPIASVENADTHEEVTAT